MPAPVLEDHASPIGFDPPDMVTKVAVATSLHTPKRKGRGLFLEPEYTDWCAWVAFRSWRAASPRAAFSRKRGARGPPPNTFL